MERPGKNHFSVPEGMEHLEPARLGGEPWLSTFAVSLWGLRSFFMPWSSGLLSDPVSSFSYCSDNVPGRRMSGDHGLFCHTVSEGPWIRGMWQGLVLTSLWIEPGDRIVAYILYEGPASSNFHNAPNIVPPPGNNALNPCAWIESLHPSHNNRLKSKSWGYNNIRYHKCIL